MEEINNRVLELKKAVTRLYHRGWDADLANRELNLLKKSTENCRKRFLKS